MDSLYTHFNINSRTNWRLPRGLFFYVLQTKFIYTFLANVMSATYFKYLIISDLITLELSRKSEKKILRFLL